jgi:hypothetical protein
MKGERRLLRAGEFLVRRATRRLPARVRNERYREWAAELPAILRDPTGGPGWRRAARMLGYALDTIRGTLILRPDRASYQGAHRGHDRWAAVKTARWLLFLLVALTILVTFLAVSVLAAYLVSWSAGVGLWPTIGILVVVLLAVSLLPRRILGASALPWAGWQIYLLAVTPSWWPAGAPVPVRMVNSAACMIATYWMLETAHDRLRRRRQLRNN